MRIYDKSFQKLKNNQIASFRLFNYIRWIRRSLELHLWLWHFRFSDDTSRLFDYRVNMLTHAMLILLSNHIHHTHSAIFSFYPFLTICQKLNDWHRNTSIQWIMTIKQIAALFVFFCYLYSNCYQSNL